MIKNIVLIVVTLLWGCHDKKDRLESIFSNSSESFKSILHNKKHQVQIIYGEIAGDSIQHHYFNVNEKTYFYPASAVKMPVAFAAIKKAQELNLSLEDRIVIDSTQTYPWKLYYDSIFQDSIRFKSLIQKIFTISDNAAYNLLYGWLGKDYINDLYASFGLRTRIVHQLGEGAYSFTPQSNNFRRKSRIINSELDTIYQSELKQKYNYKGILRNEQKGVGYIDSLGRYINKPFDFTKKNYVSLENLLTILEIAYRPDLLSEGFSFDFSKENQSSINHIMSMLPKDMPQPYDTFPDNYVKFLLFGNDLDTSIPTHIKIYNKVGWAYGYLIDIAYVKDFKNEIEFFLAAIIHVNSNEIYNDGIYEYDSIGLPFLGELGDLIYSYEMQKISRKEIGNF